MKAHRVVLLFRFLSAPAALAADAGIEFSGVLTADGRTRVALTDVASNTTRWVEAGDVFNGYTITRYDTKDDALYLRREGEEIRLGLVPARTVETPTATPAPARPVASPPAPPASQGTAPRAAPAPLPPAPAPVPPPAAAPTSNSAEAAPTSAAVPPAPTHERQPASPTYVIKGGDTLESIAREQGVPLEQIRTINPTLNSTSLRSGDTIRIR